MIRTGDNSWLIRILNWFTNMHWQYPDEEGRVKKILGMTEEELREYVKAGGRDPDRMIEDVDETIIRAKDEALERMKWRS